MANDISQAVRSFVKENKIDSTIQWDIIRQLLDEEHNNEETP